MGMLLFNKWMDACYYEICWNLSSRVGDFIQNPEDIEYRDRALLGGLLKNVEWICYRLGTMPGNESIISSCDLQIFDKFLDENMSSSKYPILLEIITSFEQRVFFQLLKSQSEDNTPLVQLFNNLIEKMEYLSSISQSDELRSAVLQFMLICIELLRVQKRTPSDTFLQSVLRATTDWINSNKDLFLEIMTDSDPYQVNLVVDVLLETKNRLLLKELLSNLDEEKVIKILYHLCSTHGNDEIIKDLFSENQSLKAKDFFAELENFLEDPNSWKLSFSNFRKALYYKNITHIDIPTEKIYDLMFSHYAENLNIFDELGYLETADIWDLDNYTFKTSPFNINWMCYLINKKLTQPEPMNDSDKEKLITQWIKLAVAGGINADQFYTAINTILYPPGKFFNFFIKEIHKYLSVNKQDWTSANKADRAIEILIVAYSKLEPSQVDLTALKASLQILTENVSSSGTPRYPKQMYQLQHLLDYIETGLLQENGLNKLIITDIKRDYPSYLNVLFGSQAQKFMKLLQSAHARGAERHQKDLDMFLYQNLYKLTNLRVILGNHFFSFIKNLLATSLLPLERFLEGFSVFPPPYCHQLRHFIDESFGYDLGAISEPQRNPGKIYLKKSTEDELQYEVIDLNGILQKGTISWSQLNLPTDFPKNLSTIMRSEELKERFLETFLSQTSEAYYTHSFSKKPLPKPADYNKMESLLLGVNGLFVTLSLSCATFKKIIEDRQKQMDMNEHWMTQIKPNLLSLCQQFSEETRGLKALIDTINSDDQYNTAKTNIIDELKKILVSYTLRDTERLRKILSLTAKNTSMDEFLGNVNDITMLKWLELLGAEQNERNQIATHYKGTRVADEVIPLLPMILRARNKMGGNPYQVVFDEMLKADLLPGRNFEDFKNNLHQASEVGKALAQHNANIGRLLQEGGINTEIAFHYRKVVTCLYGPTVSLNKVLYDVWVNLDQLKKEISNKLGQYPIVGQKDPLYKNLLDLKAKIEKFQHEILKGEKTEISAENIHALNKMCQEGCSNLISSMETSIINSKSFTSLLPDDPVSTSLKTCLAVLDSYKKEKTNIKQVKEVNKFRIMHWDKSSLKTLTLGDELSCCLATTGFKFHAMVQRRMDDAMFMHIVVNESNEPVCGEWLFFAKDKTTNNIYVVANFFELRDSYANKPELRDYLISELQKFTATYAQEVGAKGFIMRHLTYGHIPDFNFNQVIMNIEKVGGYLLLPNMIGDSSEELYYLEAVKNNTFHIYPMATFSPDLITYKP